ncbi:MAG: DUF2334 domain-containing protein, partial [Dehalococcoidia bacterium]
LSIIISFVLLVTVGCSALPGKKSSNLQDITNGQAGHVRKIDTASYAGDSGAIIFTMYGMGDSKLEDTADKIIRVFAENGVPLDVAVEPTSQVSTDESKYLTDYADAGIIDFSVDGHSIDWLDVDMPNLQKAYSDLKAKLSLSRQLVNFNFGSMPAACLFPYEALNQYNYSCLQDAGFKIISTQNPKKFFSSREPVSWSGIEDPNALSRLPIVAEINYSSGSDSNDINQQISDDIDSSVKDFGVAVVEIEPGLFMGEDGKADTGKIQSLSNLVKSSKKLGQIITFQSWFRYATSYILADPTRHRVMPVYNGGSAVIFRLDDVSKGWHEDTVEAIIRVFKSNGVPLDLGVISNAAGTDSFKIPWLQQYVDQGDVGISVHGFDWTYYQLDTSKSGLTFDYIKSKLTKARDEYLHYFGVSPVALTVPTDFFDDDGYNAIDEAGFKIFATQIEIEPHASVNEPVDFQGHTDPNGMYRIPTASDVSKWDAVNKKFLDPVDISKLAETPDFCKYFSALSTTTEYNDLGYRLCSTLSQLGVAGVGIHPSAFLDATGKPDQAKLQKLDSIVKWVKTFATITTFEQWYNYTAGKSQQ